MHRFLITVLIATVLAGLFRPVRLAAAVLSAPQENTLSPEVAEIFESLRPAERVGQLFVVTFEGTSVEEGTPIFTLLTRYRVGGLVLSADNDNFDDRDDLLLTTRNLTESLQRMAFEASVVTTGEASPRPSQRLSNYLPLLIGTSHEGNSAPYTELISGVTTLPSAMAIGAAWSGEAAKVVGEIAGYELSQLGINLLLGPNLDVLQYPQPSNPGDPGVRSFGGHQYWVSELGRSYVAGVHSGSEGRIAVVAKAFPGTGAADRATELDIPAISKGLDELLALDIAPYAAVTMLDQDPLSVVDGLMPSQARYSSLQGSLSSMTRPLSLDGLALGSLMRLPSVAPWRAEGGILLSSPLGRRGIRRFYDPTGTTFPAFEIARDALLAGNDLLFMDEFGLEPPQDQLAAVSETIDRFVQKYEADPAFAERVDQAAQRVIGLKLRLYGRLALGNVLPQDDLALIGSRATDVFDLAQEALTLISPSPAVLAERMPRAPATYERIVVFTDARAARQCSVCATIFQPEIDGLEQAIVRLYGYPGSGEISGFDISSFSFSDLSDYMAEVRLPATPIPIASLEDELEPLSSEETTEPMPLLEPTISEALESAKWLVFLLRDVDGEDPQGNALRRFLSERHDLIADPNVVVFAMGAPYLLDATEVSQLSAYYALYNRTAPFVEVAARVLFQEIVPHSALPVSVSAASYELDQHVSADPSQRFQLFRENPVESRDESMPGTASAGKLTATTTVPLPPGTQITVQVPEGTTVSLSTSTLLDLHGHQVPDGTWVEFEASYMAEGGLTRKFAELGTTSGVARATLVLSRTGLIEIRARSGQAVSDTLQINVSVSQGQPTIEVQTVTPTVTASATVVPTLIVKPRQTDTNPAPTLTRTPILTLTSIPSTRIPPSTPGPTLPSMPLDSQARPHINAWDLLSASLAMVVVGRAGLDWSRSRGRSTARGTRIILIVTIGVWSAYNYYALQLPGAASLRHLGALAPSLFAWSGGLAGLVLGWYWPRKSITNRQR